MTIATLAYLWLNAVLYAAFAIWCTIAPEKTAAGVGFTFRSGSGRSEFIAVYGGLEFGVALFFALCAIKPALTPAGVWFGLLFYAGIVAFRLLAFTTTPLATIERPTYILATLEAALLLWAILLASTGALSPRAA